MNWNATDEQINAFVVDDERLARDGLTARLKSFPEVSVSGAFSSADDAYKALSDSVPDVIFLDIEMPGLSGMEFLQLLQHNHVNLPYIVFTTAHQDFALQAFDFEPCDYMLKPFDGKRLDTCLERLKKHLHAKRLEQKTVELDGLLSRKTGKTLDCFIQNLEDAKSCQLSELKNKMSFKVGTEWIKVALDDICWVEAAGDYMCLHLDSEQHIIRRTMKQLEQELNPSLFPRINRSAIINLSKIQKLTPNSNGEYLATLSSGDMVKVSRKYKFKLDELRAC